MSFKIVQNDICKITSDVIVNSANPRPICGGSTEAMIYDAAGYDNLLNARAQIGYLEVGKVGVTPAFALNAKNIIHVSCPRWNNGAHESIEILKDCYHAVLQKAVSIHAKSIAIPLLSSGVYGFPKKVALEIAAKTCRDFNDKSLEIILVIYDSDTLFACQNLLLEIEELQENFDDEVKEDSDEICYCSECISDNAIQELSEESFYKNEESFSSFSPRSYHQKALSFEQSLDEIANVLKTMDDDSFQDKLNFYITRSDLEPSDIYKAANLNRKLFSKLKKEGYRPSKNTVLALSVGLRLNVNEAADFLSRAGYGFSPASKTDAIFKYCISQNNFYKKDILSPIYKINDFLEYYGEDVLGESLD